MILYKRSRTNERRRKISGGGGGLKKCFFYYPEGLLLQIATAFLLLQSAIGTTKCDRTPSSWVTTVVASGLPQFAPAPTPAEKGDWWDHS